MKVEERASIARYAKLELDLVCVCQPAKITHIGNHFITDFVMSRV